jgi:hypothetical protein
VTILLLTAVIVLALLAGAGIALRLRGRRIARDRQYRHMPPPPWWGKR